MRIPGLARVLPGAMLIVAACGDDPIQVVDDPETFGPGEWIYYTQRPAGAADRTLLRIRPDGTGAEELTDPEAIGDVLSFHVSPAGRIVLRTARDDDEGLATFGLWTAEPDGSGATLILERQGLLVGPRWHPDGESMVVGVRDGPEEAWLEVVTTSGERRRIGAEALAARHPRWSPDGSTLAYTALTAGEPWSLRAVAAGGTGDRALAEAAGFGPPAWSPDGRTVYAVVSNEAGADAVIAVGAASNDLRVVLDPDVSGVEPLIVAVAPDGGRLALLARGSSGSAGLYLLDVDGGEPELIHGAAEGASTVAFRPNGEHVGFNGAGLRVKRLAGGARTLATGTTFAVQWVDLD